MPHPPTAEAALKVMIDVRVRATERVVANGKYSIISEHLGDTSAAEQAAVSAAMQSQGYFRYFEFFDPKQWYIETLLNETQRGAAAESPLPIVCRQLIYRYLNLVDSIAAFMIVMANYSYYQVNHTCS